MSLSAKQIAQAVVKGKKPDTEERGNGRDDLEVAAGNIISASKSGDASELSEALSEFVSLCKE